MALHLLANGAQALECVEITPQAYCEFVNRWGLGRRTANKALVLGAWWLKTFTSHLWIISGFRTDEEQSHLAELFAAGDPEVAYCPADPSQSAHTVYPSRAFDVGFDGEVSLEHKRALGVYGTTALGLTWGGVWEPPDWNHFQWDGEEMTV